MIDATLARLRLIVAALLVAMKCQIPLEQSTTPMSHKINDYEDEEAKRKGGGGGCKEPMVKEP